MACLCNKFSIVFPTDCRAEPAVARESGTAAAAAGPPSSGANCFLRRLNCVRAAELKSTVHSPDGWSGLCSAVECRGSKRGLSGLPPSVRPLSFASISYCVTMAIHSSPRSLGRWLCRWTKHKTAPSLSRWKMSRVALQSVRVCVDGLTVWWCAVAPLKERYNRGIQKTRVDRRRWRRWHGTMALRELTLNKMMHFLLYSCHAM